MQKIRIRLGAVMLLFLVSCMYSETVRERANIHFDMIDWMIDSSIVPHVEKPGVELPGGNETFAVLSSAKDTGVAGIYPEAEGLGVIEYSGTESGVLSLLTTLGTALQKKYLAAALCNPDRPFLAPLTVFRLGKLPDIKAVLFSRPQVSDTGSSSVRYRLKVLKNDKPGYVYLTVTVTGQAAAPVIDDIVFDGDSYAGFAEQN